MGEYQYVKVAAENRIATILLLAAALAIAASSNGLTVCMSSTRASIPFSASIAAASRETATIMPHAMMVTSLPSRTTFALPISNGTDVPSASSSGYTCGNAPR